MPFLHPLCCRPYATADDAVVHSFQYSQIRQSYIAVDNTCFLPPAGSRTCRLNLSLPNIRSSYSRIFIPSSPHLIPTFHPNSSSHSIPYPLFIFPFPTPLILLRLPRNTFDHTPISTMSQHLAAVLQLPHPTSLVPLRLSRTAFNHTPALARSQHLAALLRLQALHSPNTYRMHSRLMRDAGEPDQ